MGSRVEGAGESNGVGDYNRLGEIAKLATTYKKQQMQWSKPGAHLLLQTRVKTLDGELGALFKRWYPDMDLEERPAGASSPASPRSP
jgi:hypothetical protein